MTTSYAPRRALPPRVILPGAILVMLTGSLFAQELHQRLEGQVTYERLGSQVLGTPDLDGDGTPDYLVSAINAAAGKGEVQAFSGATGASLFTITGPDFNGGVDWFGISLLVPGDLDGDGSVDLVVGAAFDNHATIPGLNHGSYSAYSGSTRKRLYKVEGQDASAYLGMSLAAVADLDGDQVMDYAVGESFGANPSGDRTGRVRLVSGATGAHLFSAYGGAAADYFGRSLDTLTDLDGDAVPELVVGAPQWTGLPGYVQVVSGATGALLYQVNGLLADDWYGIAVAALDDLDGDGAPEILVGGSQLTAGGGSGYVTVLSGLTGTLLALHSGAAPNDQFGVSVADAGDVNGDGFGDYVVGATQWSYLSTQVGYARLFSGRTDALLYAWEGHALEDGFGTQTAGLGDLDGDGLAELAVTAPNGTVDPNLGGEGWLEIYRGNDLYLNASSNQLAQGMNVAVTLREGAFGKLAITYVVSVNGVSTWVPLHRGWLDGTGTLGFAGTVPPGLSGTTLLLRSYSHSAIGDLIVSGDETLAIL